MKPSRLTLGVNIDKHSHFFAISRGQMLHTLDGGIFWFILIRQTSVAHTALKAIDSSVDATLSHLRALYHWQQRLFWNFTFVLTVFSKFWVKVASLARRGMQLDCIEVWIVGLIQDRPPHVLFYLSFGLAKASEEPALHSLCAVLPRILFEARA